MSCDYFVLFVCSGPELVGPVGDKDFKNSCAVYKVSIFFQFKRFSLAFNLFRFISINPLS